jgi:putative membrane-bound dehydrogenase-like protein
LRFNPTTACAALGALLFPALGAPAAAQEAVPPRVAGGYVIEQVAGPDQVRFPMFAAFDDRGRLFVTESSGGDLYSELVAQARTSRIRLLEDRDGDGSFEHSTVFADKLNVSMGLVWRDGKLYAADPPDLVTLEDTDGDGRADRREVVLSGFGHTDNGSLHGLTFGPDGLLYMTMGEPDGYRLPRGDGTFLEGKAGALLRCRPDGGRPEAVARGFVNLVEVAFTGRGEVLGTDNWFQQPADGLRDAIVHLVDGGLYPFVQDEGTRHPETGDRLPAAGMFPAAALSGLALYRGESLGAEFRGNLFSAQHNTRAVQRHELLREGSTLRTRDHDFVTSDDPDFHPSDVLEDADGSLLVLDTGAWYVQHCPTGRIRSSPATGGIWRVRRAEAPRIDDPWGAGLASRRLTIEGWVNLLADPRPAVQDLATRALQANPPAVPALAARLHEASTDDDTRQRVVWALAGVDHPDAAAALRSALGHESPAVIAAAARALGRRADRGSAAMLAGRLSHNDATVRLAAAEAIARVGTAEALPSVWAALRRSPDRFLRHALTLAAHHLATQADLETALGDADPAVQRAALELLDQPPRTGLAPEAVVRLVGSPEADLRRAASDVLKRHAAWAGHARDVLGALLARPDLAEPEFATAGGWVAAFAADAGVQDLVTETLKDGRAAPELRTALLRALEQTTIAPVPRPLGEAVVASIRRGQDEPVRWAAIRAARTLGVSGAQRALLEVVEGAREPQALRLEALAGLVDVRPALSPAAFDLVLASVARRSPPADRLAAAGVVARAEVTSAQVARLLAAVRGDVLLSPDTFLPMLARSNGPEVAAAVEDYLLAAAARGWRPAPADAERVRALVGEAARATLTSMLEKRDAESRAKLDRFRPLLTGGDPARGRAVFAGAVVACAACHRVGGVGGLVGPDLTKAGAIRSGNDLLESILIPGSTIAQGYDQYVAVLDGGERRAGTLASQTPDAITLRDAGGIERRIARGELKDLRRLTVSLMPEGLEAGLTHQEFRDLLAYLQSLK